MCKRIKKWMQAKRERAEREWLLECYKEMEPKIKQADERFREICEDHKKNQKPKPTLRVVK